MGALLVGIGDMKVGRAGDVITTLGLGSCVGVVLYDKSAKIGGMAHIMLPSSKGFDASNRAKFADLAIIDLVNLMGRAGARRGALTAKIAGGAHMFSGKADNVLMVGDRNVAACKEILRLLNIPVTAMDVGGTFGRTIELHTDTGGLNIRTVGAGQKMI
ncbi:MAG: chemotaxis protein CheD [Oscillospiraceae bacterium]|jgi:chemotaxis protein CheD|nr:chemotaxis protein CheD [Oscillospiraceae bacterium]